MLFLQMPMVFTRGVDDISIDSIAGYVPLNIHCASPVIIIDCAECSLSKRIKADGKLLQGAIGKRQCVAVDSDGYIFFPQTQ